MSKPKRIRKKYTPSHNVYGMPVVSTVCIKGIDALSTELITISTEELDRITGRESSFWKRLFNRFWGKQKSWFWV